MTVKSGWAGVRSQSWRERVPDSRDCSIKAAWAEWIANEWNEEENLMVWVEWWTLKAEN